MSIWDPPPPPPLCQALYGQNYVYTVAHFTLDHLGIKYSVFEPRSEGQNEKSRGTQEIRVDEKMILFQNITEKKFRCRRTKIKKTRSS